MDERDLEVHRVAADRDIIAFNMASAVNQAVAMMTQRDGAVKAAQEAKGEAAVALTRQNELQSLVSGLE